MLRLPICTILMLVAWPMLVNAQNPDPFREFDRMFDEMLRQRQGMTRTDTIRIDGNQREFFQISPDSSSYFYFRIDTSFGNPQIGGDFFRMDPHSGDGSDGLDAFNEMFRRMEEMHRQMGIRPWGFEIPLAEEPLQDGDGLLPEERIRDQEQQVDPNAPQKSDQIAKPRTPGGAPKTPPAKTEPPAPAKPRIRTSRI
jgi:hypothetical protein